MSHLLYGWNDGRNEEAALILRHFVGWALGAIPWVDDFGRCTCIAVCSEPALGEPLAVVVYHNMDARSRALEISMAASTPRWATRGTIRACLHYPFTQLGCGVVVCRTPRRQRRTKRFLSGIGFTNCGTVPFGYGDDAASIYAMTKQQAARWLTMPLELPNVQAA